jgi:hypothetical protein
MRLAQMVGNVCGGSHFLHSDNAAVNNGAAIECHFTPV